MLWFIFQKFKIKEVMNVNENIATMVGIHIGDGSLSRWINKSTGTIQEKWTVCPGDDKEFAILVVRFLNKINLNAKIHPKNKKFYVVDSYDAVAILKRYFRTGNKTKTVDIPEEFRKPPLINNVLKGIFSCDGCIALGNNGVYLSFDTASEKLAKSILESLKSLGFKAYFYKYEGLRKPPTGPISKRTIFCVRIWSKSNINKFMKEIGSINPKHLKRYKEWLRGFPSGQRGTIPFKGMPS